MNHNIKKNRRQFIKKGLFGLAGMVSAPALLKPGDREKKIIYRKLGKTGIKLPIISIGAGSYEASLYKTALDRGIKHIDTAQYYSNGRHERLVGEVIKNRPRDSIIIGTSVYLGKETTSSAMSIKDAPTLVTRFERSLTRMGTDYVDIFYVSGVSRSEEVLNEDLLSGLAKLKKSGKVRFIGIATHQNEPEVIDTVIKHKFHEVILTAYNFRQTNGDEVRKAIARASRAGIGIIAMKTMAGAYWDKEQKQPINTKAALKWVVRDTNVHTSVPAVENMDQLETNLSIMENLELTPREKKDLKPGDKLALAGLYCQQCGKCIPQCPYSLEIPPLMRSYMYAYGYRNLSKARQTLNEVDLSKVGCKNCTHCSVHCGLGFDVREKVLDIIRLKEVPDDFLV